jgi:small-conductance mechanosensitive channel
MIAEGFKEIFKYFTSQAFLMSLLIVLISLADFYLIKQYLIKKVAYTTKSEQHKNTFLGIFFNILQYAVAVIAFVLIMKFHGFDIAGIFSGLGIAATIGGLALQDSLKDIIAGINIYNHNFYKVGDLVRYNGEECDVKYFSTKVTKFQSINTKATYTVNNSEITSIEKIKEGHVQHYIMNFKTDRATVDECFNVVCERMKKECKDVRSVKYESISDITTKGVEYEIKYDCPAHKGEEVKDQMMSIAYDEMIKRNIEPATDEIIVYRG